MSRRIDWRGWLALGRVSNLPTVWTNVLAGAGLGHALAGGVFDVALGLRVAGVWLAASLLYLAGMIFNDVCDFRADLDERPQRPLPAGRGHRRSAALATAIAAATGVGLTVPVGWATASLAIWLAAAIASYDLLHKRHVAAVGLMGLCRGLVYLMAVTAVAPQHSSAALTAILVACIMAAYTVLITVIAHGEASDRPPRRPWPAWGMLLAPPAVALVVSGVTTRPLGLTLVASLLLAAALLWLIRSMALLRRHPPRIGPAIEGYLAGFALIDAVMLAWLGLPATAAAATILFIITHLAHQRIRGT